MARSASAGTCRNSAAKASSPPADAPTPTIVKSVSSSAGFGGFLVGTFLRGRLGREATLAVLRLAVLGMRGQAPQREDLLLRFPAGGTVRAGGAEPDMGFSAAARVRRRADLTGVPPVAVSALNSRPRMRWACRRASRAPSAYPAATTAKPLAAA